MNAADPAIAPIDSISTPLLQGFRPVIAVRSAPTVNNVLAAAIVERKKDATEPSRYRSSGTSPATTNDTQVTAACRAA